MRSTSRKISEQVEKEPVQEQTDLEEGSLLLKKSKAKEEKLILPEVVEEAGSYPELIAISLVYFVQGIVSLSSLAVAYFLKDTLLQRPAQVEFLQGFRDIPWVIKPIYGFASDNFPIFGYRRRSYLVLCGLLSSSAWIILGTNASSVSGTLALLITGSLGSACSDVVVDSIVVQRVRGKPQSAAASLQAVCWASRAVGGVISAYSSGFIVDHFGPRFVFKSIAFFPLLVTVGALLVKETPVNQSSVLQEPNLIPTRKSNNKSDFLSVFRSHGTALWSAFNQKRIYLPVLFMFVYCAVPNASSAMFFFETTELHFSPDFMGKVALFGQIASLLGVGIYNFFLKSVPLKKIFGWSCILSIVLGSTQFILISGINREFGLSDQLFVLGDSVILTALSQVAFMPGLVLAARICPEGVEATLFALLMSIYNGGSLVSNAIGAWLTDLLGVTNNDFTNLALLISICLASNLIPLTCLALLPEDLSEEEPSRE